MMKYLTATQKSFKAEDEIKVDKNCASGKRVEVN